MSPCMGTHLLKDDNFSTLIIIFYENLLFLTKINIAIFIVLTLTLISMLLGLIFRQSYNIHHFY